MFTVRQLLNSAFRVSGMYTNDTPDNTEISDALSLLNGVLDTFGLQRLWKPGKIKRTVTPRSGKIVIANDLTRVITSIISSYPGEDIANVTTSGNHGLSIGSEITLFNCGVFSGTVTVTSITSTKTFQFVPGVAGTISSGVFKLSSESDDYLMDLVLDPPPKIYSVNNVSSGGNEILSELSEDEFYALTSDICGSYYYEKAQDPYPTLFVSPTIGSVDVVMEQPGFRNVVLDTNIEKWPQGMGEALKWRVAGDIAGINGFPDISTQCLSRFAEAVADYKRANRKLNPVLIDGSAPGSRGQYYDIRTDSFV